MDIEEYYKEMNMNEMQLRAALVENDHHQSVLTMLLASSFVAEDVQKRASDAKDKLRKIEGCLEDQLRDKDIAKRIEMLEKIEEVLRNVE